MTLNLTSKISTSVLADLTNPLDLSTPADRLDKSTTIRLASGTAAGQADRIWHDQRTLAASASEDLDLAGSLTDALGNTVTFATVKAIMIKAASGNTNNVVAGNATSNAFVGPWGATGTMSTKPGGLSAAVAPGTGWTVTASTGDLLKVANSGAGTSVTYDIVIIGTSA